MGESAKRRNRRLSRPGRRSKRLKYEPKKILPVDERISFYDFAKFARRKKTIQFLVDRAECDPSTAKRWLAGKSPASGAAVRAIVADIMVRLR
jgi:hypothetical protein